MSDYYTKLVDFFSSNPVRYNWIHYVLLFGLPYRKVSQLIDPKPDSRILDIGCGPSQILDHLDTYGSYTGVDENNDHIDYAARKYNGRSNTRFLCGNVLETEIPETDKFDRVLMLGFMHHLPDTACNQLLLNIKSRISGNGFLLTFDPVLTRHHLISNMLCKLDRGRFVRDKDGYLELLSNNFEVIDTRIILPRSGMLFFCVNKAIPR